MGHEKVLLGGAGSQIHTVILSLRQTILASPRPEFGPPRSSRAILHTCSIWLSPPPITTPYHHPCNVICNGPTHSMRPQRPANIAFQKCKLQNLTIANMQIAKLNYCTLFASHFSFNFPVAGCQGTNPKIIHYLL